MLACLCTHFHSFYKFPLLPAKKPMLVCAIAYQEVANIFLAASCHAAIVWMHGTNAFDIGNLTGVSSPALMHVTCISAVAREVKLSSLSPVLSQMASTAIPIPGLVPINPFPPSHTHQGSQGATAFDTPSQAQFERHSQKPYQISSADLVTLSSFKASVHVMSTKTRPKRIGIIGSDGRTYTFLLKVCLTLPLQRSCAKHEFMYAYHICIRPASSRLASARLKLMCSFLQIAAFECWYGQLCVRHPF